MLTCELSGEPLAGTKEEIVATPSGHVCIKRLLLTKLSENGGMDPFETIRERPLSEDQLITLATNPKHHPRPRPQADSLPNLLQTIQSEYDGLVLELFDTRKALEETRRELSQSLYQYDAAVRVVARLSIERDTARQELERWQASVGDAPTTNTSNTTNGTAGEPQTKKRKLDLDEPLKNDLPEEDHKEMIETWDRLRPQRKPMLKAAAAAAPSPDDLSKYSETDDKAWHKSTCKSVPCMASSGDLIVTGGSDKKIFVVDATEKVVKHTLSLGRSGPRSLGIGGSLIVSGDSSGQIAAFSAEDGSSHGALKVEGNLVDVRVHPTTKHICAATSTGQLLVCRAEDGKLQLIGQFESGESVQYLCGAVHPDGLLYAAGTANGKVHMWDFQRKNLGSTLQEGDTEDAIVAVSFSSNGYLFATAHESGCVHFWDLRKEKTIATLNSEKDMFESVTCIAFDESGKFAAIGGDAGVKVVVVKGLSIAATLASTKPVSSIVWNKSMIVTCSDKERNVRFFGSA